MRRKNKHTIGLDLGTTAVKGVAVDDEGRVVASKYIEYSTYNPKPGWAEQSPEEWWDKCRITLRYLVSKVKPSSIISLGLSGQMHGLVMLDKDFQPAANAIPWLDRRSTKEVDYLRKKIGDRQIYQTTGNPLFTGFLLPSLMWIRNNNPEIFRSVSKVCSPKDYLAHLLTGNLKTEPTDALATAAFDLGKGNWSREMIESAGICTELFPEIIPTISPYGTITKTVSINTGLPEGIPVYGGSDQSMAAMGVGLVEDGQALISVSTGGQFLLSAPEGKTDKKMRLHTLNHALPEKGLYMAATLSAGLSLRWFKNRICGLLEVDYARFLDGVEKIPPGSGGLLFLPFLNGERTPYFNPDLRGGFFGLTASHSRQHMIRSILEGVAFSLKDCLLVFQEMKLPVKKIVISGGGGKSRVWRQIITDVLGFPTQTVSISDHSPYGAAIFARFANEGFDKLMEFYGKTIKTGNLLKPDKTRNRIYRKIFKKYRKLVDMLDYDVINSKGIRSSITTYLLSRLLNRPSIPLRCPSW